MSHEITETDHMVSANSVLPWHGLGTVVPATALGSAEALKLARLDWEVNQECIFDQDMIEIPGFRINRRSDNSQILGMVSDQWEPIQNHLLLELAEALVQVEDAEFRPVIETAGSLKGGAIVWALVQVGERTFADSAHRSYLLLSNGHDGKRAMKGTLTDVRVVCNNTLGAAERSLASFSVNHRKGTVKRTRDAVEALNWSTSHTQSLFAIYESLAAVKITEDQAFKGFQKLVKVDGKEEIPTRTSNILDNLMQLYSDGPGNSGSSAFDFLNAVTDYADHHRSSHDQGSEEANQENRFYVNCFSTGNAMKQAGKKIAMTF